LDLTTDEEFPTDPHCKIRQLLATLLKVGYFYKGGLWGNFLPLNGIE